MTTHLLPRPRPQAAWHTRWQRRLARYRRKMQILKIWRQQQFIRDQHILLNISGLLSEPLRDAARLLRANTRYHRDLSKKRHDEQSASTLHRIRQRLTCPQANSYRQLIEADPRSRIIVCFHFGNFVYGMPYLKSLEPRSRPVLLLIQSQPGDEYFHNMRIALPESHTHEAQFLLSNNTNPRQLLRHLRKSPCSLYLFCDLPDTFGATGEVSFLSRPAQFPRGAASLALLAGVPLLPVITLCKDKQDIVTLGNQLEPTRYPNESREDATTRLSQQLVDFFAPHFRQHPEHWKFLPFLPGYMAAPAAPNTNTTVNHQPTSQRRG
ncbi:MAG: hypothetical protein ACR2PR_02615 [Pseudohongiellaceae bacterium]